LQVERQRLLQVPGWKVAGLTATATANYWLLFFNLKLATWNLQPGRF
jgi:hypothetical protein